MHMHIFLLQTLRIQHVTGHAAVAGVKRALTSLVFVGVFRASSVQFVASEMFPSSL